MDNNSKIFRKMLFKNVLDEAECVCERERECVCVCVCVCVCLSVCLSV